MLDFRVTPPRTSPSPRRGGLGALWRWFLPAAIVFIGTAVLTGVFDTTGRPFWLFVGGIACAVIGVTSLIKSLVDQGRAELAAAEERLAAQFHHEDPQGKDRP